jgi:hypothetical protein
MPTTTAAPPAAPVPPPPSGVLRARRIGNCVLAALFVLALWLPVLQRPLKIGRFFHDDQGNWTGFGDLDKRFQEGFAFRDVLLKLRVELRLGIFDLLPDTVIRGKDGWLFYDSEIVHDGHSFDDFRGEVHPDQATLSNWRSVMTVHAEERQWPNSLVVIVVPNKQTIYPDLLPAALARQRGGRTRADDAVAELTDPQLPLPQYRATVIDLRPAFLKARTLADGTPSPPLYYRTDSHWTERGARVAEAAISQALIAAHIPDFTPLPAAVLTPRMGTYRGDIGNLVLGKNIVESAEFLDVDHIWPARTAAGAPVLGPSITREMIVSYFTRSSKPDDPIHPLITTVDDPNLPTAVIFHDSFGPCMLPWMAQHFRRAVWCWNCSWDEALVDREKPSVVIVERVERYVDRLFADGPPVAP